MADTMDCKHDYNPAQLIMNLPEEIQELVKARAVNTRRQLIITASCYRVSWDSITFCIKPAQGVPGSYEATFLSCRGRQGAQAHREFNQTPNIYTKAELMNYVTHLAVDFTEEDDDDYYGDAHLSFTSKCCAAHAREYEVRPHYDDNWTAGYPAAYGEDAAYYYPEDPGSDDSEYMTLDTIQADTANVVQIALNKMLDERIDHEFQLDPCPC